MMKYEIVDIDLWEHDALVKIGDEKFYFQFSGNEIPTLLDALRYWKREVVRLEEK